MCGPWNIVGTRSIFGGWINSSVGKQRQWWRIINIFGALFCTVHKSYISLPRSLWKLDSHFFEFLAWGLSEAIFMEDMRTHMQDTCAGHDNITRMWTASLNPYQVPEKSVGAGRHSCCCSLAKSCPTLLNPMDCIMPVFPVLHCLPEFAHTPVHWVSDAIQPSHPLLSPSPSVLYL